MANTKLSYIELPCDRCGSKKLVSKSWSEDLETSAGTSQVEVSQIICSNKECQAEFEGVRATELVKINERKVKKEEADKVRRDNIAKTILERRKTRAAAEGK